MQNKGQESEVKNAEGRGHLAERLGIFIKLKKLLVGEPGCVSVSLLSYSNLRSGQCLRLRIAHLSYSGALKDKQRVSSAHTGEPQGHSEEQTPATLLPVPTPRPAWARAGLQECGGLSLRRRLRKAEGSRRCYRGQAPSLAP